MPRNSAVIEWQAEIVRTLRFAQFEVLPPFKPRLPLDLNLKVKGGKVIITFPYTSKTLRMYNALMHYFEALASVEYRNGKTFVAVLYCKFSD